VPRAASLAPCTLWPRTVGVGSLCGETVALVVVLVLDDSVGEPAGAGAPAVALVEVDVVVLVLTPVEPPGAVPAGTADAGAPSAGAQESAHTAAAASSARGSVTARRLSGAGRGASVPFFVLRIRSARNESSKQIPQRRL